MRVAVTGATGFVGGHVAERLAASGHEVVRLGRRLPPAGQDGPRFVRWDLADPADPAPDVLADVEAVVHAAAHVSDWGPWETFRQATVDGTGRLIDSIGQARLIVIGSASVYDPFRGHPCAHEDEAPVQRYRNNYGRAKAAQERLVRRRRPDAVILRPHLVYGRGDPTLLPRLIRARRRGRLLLPAGGRFPMSITHVDTVVDAVAAALDHPDVRGPVNVSDATPVRPRDLMRAAFEALRLPTSIHALPLPMAWPAAHAFETAYRGVGWRTAPPLTTYIVSHLAWPFVLDLSRLHGELEIAPDRSFRDAVGELAGLAAPPA